VRPPRQRFLRQDLAGRGIIARDGQELGTVADTWPVDGGGEPELVLIRLGRFGRRRWLALSDISLLADRLFVRWTASEIADAPDAEDHRWGDPALVARAHWLTKSD
jgi:hypothetical protein